jgi:hypothetical protein
VLSGPAANQEKGYDWAARYQEKRARRSKKKKKVDAHPPTHYTHLSILAVNHIIIIISTERTEEERNWVTARPPTDTYQEKENDATRASHSMQLMGLADL